MAATISKETSVEDEAAKSQPTIEEAFAKDETAKAPMFSGSQLIKFASGINRDVMIAVLSPAKQYTEAEAKDLIDKFLKKEVVSNGGRKLDNAE
nr:hypothetical protein [uncultured Caproiciproducens sp.]